jgi:hypothetical protein
LPMKISPQTSTTGAPVGERSPSVGCRSRPEIPSSAWRQTEEPAAPASHTALILVLHYSGTSPRPLSTEIAGEMALVWPGFFEISREL